MTLWARRPTMRRSTAVVAGIAAAAAALVWYDAYTQGGAKRLLKGWAQALGGSPQPAIEAALAAARRESFETLPFFNTDVLPSESRASKESADVDKQSDETSLPSEQASGESSDQAGSKQSRVPDFFMSTKFFACLELEESKELFEASSWRELAPHEVLFRKGDPSEDGIYVCTEGCLGVYLHDDTAAAEDDNFLLVNVLKPGESVGDLDVIDGAQRSVTCMSMEESTTLLCVPRALFLRFIAEKPHTLDLYLRQAIARLWRVAHFVVMQYLMLQGDSAVDFVPFTDPANEMSRAIPEEAQNTVLELVKTVETQLPPSPASIDVLRSEVVESCCQTIWSSELVRKVTIRAGTLLQVEGDSADCFHVLLSGRLVVDAPPPTPRAPMTNGSTHTSSNFLRPSDSRDSWPVVNNWKHVSEVSTIAIIGAASFLTSTKRRETVRAAEACQLAIFSHEDLERLQERAPQLFLQIMLLAARSLAALIRRFITLGLNRVWHHSGETVYEKGQPATSLFILISGRVHLMRDMQEERLPDRMHDGDKTRLPVPEQWRQDDVVRGGTMGEASLISGGTHDHTALCIRDAELVRMSRPAFEKVCRESPAVVARIVDSLIRRLRRAGRAEGSGSKRGQPSELVTIALFPADASCELQPLSDQLCVALQLLGPTLQLSSHDVAMQFRDATAAKLHIPFYRSKLTAWMAAQEESYRFIVLQGDPHAVEWTHLCITQADIVLVAGMAQQNPTVQPHEQKMLWDRAERLRSMHRKLPHSFLRAELVLLHQPVPVGRKNQYVHMMPTGSKAWLEPRRCHRHHHVRVGVDADMIRLARYLAGRSVGLVLSGGGSRGLAHLGVIRALEDAGIPIDCVGGTSQGAFMGALYAKFLTSQAMVPKVREFAAKLGSVWHLLRDLTLPVLAIFHGTGFTKTIKHALGDTQIEDLWLRYFCVSTNVTKGDIAVHERGDLWKYVRASMTVIGLLPPIYDKGDLLVDGGYVDNVPVDIMRRMGVRTVIVVDVEDKDNSAFEKAVLSEDGGVSGWWLLLDRLIPFRQKRICLPKYSELTSALMYVSHMRQLRSVRSQNKIDLYLRPTGINDYSLLDYHRMEEIVRGAYRYGWAAVGDWQRSQLESGVDCMDRLGVMRKRIKESASSGCMTMLKCEPSPDEDQDDAGCIVVPPSKLNMNGQLRRVMSTSAVF
eukprot:jgi/Chlat1/5479/Chrsp36S05433